MTGIELAGGYVLTELHWHAMTDAQVAEGVQLGNAMQREILPDQPDETLERALSHRAAAPERVRRWVLRVHDSSGQLVASGGCSLDPEHDDNPDLQWCGLNVLTQHRRRGLGAALLRRLVDIAETEGRSRLVSMTADELADGGAFATAVGAVAKQAQHLNELPCADVDRALLEGWVADAASRSADYALLTWDGPCPAEHLDSFLDLYPVMNTAPLDDFELNDFTLTVEQLREQEQMALAAGLETWTSIAVHRGTGAFVGLHDVFWSPHDPAHVMVGATGVRPEHRGHALGKWLKAAMTLRVLDDRPEVTGIRTGNADSNDAMLAINRAMGYRPVLGQTTWELGTRAARTWLTSRTPSPSPPEQS